MICMVYVILLHQTCSKQHVFLHVYDMYQNSFAQHRARYYVMATRD